MKKVALSSCKKVQFFKIGSQCYGRWRIFLWYMVREDLTMQRDDTAHDEREKENRILYVA